MAEEVSTGGLMRFRYSNGNEPKLDDKRRNDIREAYALAEKREKLEKRNRIIFWIIGVIILVLLSFIVFLNSR